MLEGVAKSSADLGEAISNKVKALEEKSGLASKIKGRFLQTDKIVFG